MDASGAVENGDVRGLTPLPLWIGILAGPVAWAFDLTSSYAVVKWVCHTGNYGVLRMITIASLVMVAAGAWFAWNALSTTGDEPTDGGRPRQRARFMAVLGLAACALFALQIVAGDIPRWVLDACH